GEVLELARCMCGGEVAPWDAAEAIAAEGLSARGVEPDDPLAGLPDPVPTPLPEDESRTPMPALDWSAVEEALPDDVEALTRGAEDLNAFALDRRMRAALPPLVDGAAWPLAVRETGGEAAGPPPLGTRLVRPERQVCAHAVDADITFFAPASVAILLRSAIASFTLPTEPAWQGLERLLDHVHHEWSTQPRHRDPIFARDGWRCAVPACTSRRNLHDHHLLFRSRGGGNARDNRITVCAWHHLRGIHQGRVRAWGTAPDAITWQLGCRPGQPALLTLEGDEYLVDER